MRKAGYFFTELPSIDAQGKLTYLKVFTFVIIDPDYGPMVFDTGSPYDRKTFIDSLKKLFGISPEDVEWVFNTHFHTDHIGNNILCRNARVVISKGEFEFNDKIADAAKNRDDFDFMKFLHSLSSNYSKIYDLTLSKNVRRYLNEHWSYDSLGKETYFVEDGKSLPDYVKVLKTYGHTPFHISFELESDVTKFFITGDALSNRLLFFEDENINDGEPHYNLDDFQKYIKFFYNKCGIIIPGHDRPFHSSSLRGIRNPVFDFDKIVLD